MVAWFGGRRVHSSWHIAAASVGIVAGIVLSNIAPLGQYASVAWLLTGIVLIVTSIWKSRAMYICFAVTGGLVVGLWRGYGALQEVSIYETFRGKTVTLHGVVKEDVELNARGQTVVRLAVSRINQSTATGTVWLTSKTDKSIARSDYVVAQAKLSPGFGSFNASAYSAQIVAVRPPSPPDIALIIRNWFAGGVQNVISEPQASLGLGYLVGQRRGLPAELDSALVAAGLTHVVVASGYNLTILVRLARRLFEKISKYLAFISAASMIVGFIAITGMSPSMSRAGLVAGLSLVAWYYGRRFHPLMLLPFAMAITLLIQPSYAWGDIGWQLSFAAFAGVMILAPLSQAYFFGDKTERPLQRILIETLSATACTLPILLLVFGQFSIVAPIANLLILPFVPLAMLLTFIAGIGGLVFEGPIGQIIALPAELLLTYMTMTITYIGNLSWAIQSVQITLLIAGCMFVAIAAACTYMWYRTKLSLAGTSLVE